MNLAELKVGESAKVKALNCDKELKNRLITMGLAQGEEVVILSKGPRETTVEVKISGSSLALRDSEAAAIEVVQ